MRGEICGPGISQKMSSWEHIGSVIAWEK
jgi:hypothetical protein